jgi:opacity protein-like surface antigen
MRKLIRMVFTIAALLSSAAAAQAQGLLPLAVEARGGFALPQGDWAELYDIGNGFGYGINARLQVLPLISIYGGWDRYSFSIEDVDSDAIDSGLHLGGQISLPLSAVTGVSPFAFAGVLYNRTTMAEASGVESESDDDFGYEVGAGLAFPFAPTLTLTPAVRYRSHSAEFSFGEDPAETTVSYLSLDVGLKLGI